MADAVLDPSKLQMNKNSAAMSRPYIEQGAGESIDDLKNRYAGLIQESNFGGSSGGGGPLADRLAALREQKLADLTKKKELELPVEYSQRQGGFLNIVDANRALLAKEAYLKKQQELAEKAKRAGFASSALGTVGGIVGAIYGGGPGGAAIGSGIGSSIGSQVG